MPNAGGVGVRVLEVGRADESPHRPRGNNQRRRIGMMGKFAAAAIAVTLSAAVEPLHAQQLAGNEDAYTSDALDAVVVLGTARKDITALTSTAPVDVISSAELQNTGAVTINEALSKLHPSFNFPQGQNAVKGQGVRAASLRGVGPGYTLVLVNGKRRNLSAELAGTDPWPATQVVDINTIPLSAIERVEVLRDGAAAQYGSDAIAGVINIVLKTDSSGGNIDARGGAYSDGGGQTYQFLGTKGFKLGDDGFLNLNVDRLRNTNVDRSAGDWRQLFPNGDSRNQSYPKDYGQWGQASRNNWVALVNAELPVTDTLRAYGWLNYANKSTNDYVNPERVVASNTASPTATNGAQISPTAVLGVYPNGYQPSMTYSSKDYAAVGGVRYGTAEFGDLDVGVSYGRNETGRYTYTSINPSWGTSSPTSFYLGSWIDHTTSVTADYHRDLAIPFIKSSVISAGALFRQESWGTGDDGDYIGYSPGPLAGLPLWSLYSSPNTVYAGAVPAYAGKTAAQVAGNYAGIYNQYASQFSGINFASATGSIGATGSSTAGISPIDTGTISRHVSGGYLGIDASVTPQFDVGATGRFEDYSDFGSTSNYRVTARYEFVPAFAVRGTISSGFHAPSLAELGQQVTSYTGTFTNNGISNLSPGYTRLFRPSDPVAATFGAKPLEPEKSTTYSLGFVIRPDDTSSVTVDAYHLKIDNVITVTDPIQGPTVTKAFAAAGLAGYTQATYYLNAWNSRTDGIDIVAQKFFALPVGKLDVSLATSYDTTSVKNPNNTVDVGGATLTVLNNSRFRDAQTGVPKNKVILSGHYSVAAWAIDATATRFSSYRYNVGNVPNTVQPNGNVDQVFSPETYLDLGFGYAVQDNVHLSLLIDNVFDKYPERYVDGNRSSGLNQYSFIAPNGASGRFILLGANWSFR
jgi:iron complex outermembrane receptor protein